MTDILNNISQAEFDAAEAALISTIRTAYPNLDLRRGTVLREILIRPQATVNAQNKQNNDTLERLSSLTSLQAAGATAAEAAGPLANFGITPYTGTTASGVIKVNVNSSRVYQLSNGFQFAASSSLAFATTQAYTARIGADISLNELELVPSSDGTYWYFLLPVVSTTAAADASVVQGTEMTPTSSFYGFVSAEAYSDFSGGTDPETLDEAIARIPVAISYRALESQLAITSRLQNYLQSVGASLYALSVQGMGAVTQLRDKHNPFGMAVGSRVDIYPRTFVGPQVTLLEKTGTLVTPGVYTFDIEAIDAPGAYFVRAVADLGAVTGSADLTTQTIVGSYPFSVIRSGDNLTAIEHDIDPDNAVEIANTVYQKMSVTVSGIADTAATHAFKVEVYTAPYLAELQALVDSVSLRNQEADILVRMPFLCPVSVRIRCYYPRTVIFDETAVKASIAAYVNGRSFVRKLTRSELIPLVISGGAQRVDLGPNGMLLSASVTDASSVTHLLSGDEIDLETVRSNTSLLAAETTVFITDPTSIFIEAIPE